MSFYSKDNLKLILPKIVGEDDYDEERLDGITYKLRMGEEIFVTRSLSNDPDLGVPVKLAQGESKKIPQGQFAFLLTEETIDMPMDAAALISLRTSFKFQGLINVSGFHVNPKWKGKLVFAVYNAGPSDIYVKRGDKLFLFMLSNLITSDIKNKINYPYPPNKVEQTDIPSEIVNSNSGKVYSPAAMAQKVNQVDIWVKTIGSLAIGLFVISFNILYGLEDRVSKNVKYDILNIKGEIPSSETLRHKNNNMAKRTDSNSYEYSEIDLPKWRTLDQDLKSYR